MLAQILADPHSTVPNLGASGAIAAVIGGFIVTYPRDQWFRIEPLPAPDSCCLGLHELLRGDLVCRLSASSYEPVIGGRSFRVHFSCDIGADPQFCDAAEHGLRPQ